LKASETKSESSAPPGVLRAYTPYSERLTRARANKDAAVRLYEAHMKQGAEEDVNKKGMRPGLMSGALPVDMPTPAEQKLNHAFDASRLFARVNTTDADLRAILNERRSRL
jgi:hypothetical protein